MKKLKNLLQSFHTITLSKGNIFVKNAKYLQKKNANISKIKVVLVLKGIFSGTTYVCLSFY